MKFIREDDGTLTIEGSLAEYGVVRSTFSEIFPLGIDSDICKERTKRDREIREYFDKYDELPEGIPESIRF
jgi:hypothetical protein